MPPAAAATPPQQLQKGAQRPSAGAAADAAPKGTFEDENG
eukprot:gene2352-7016_t